MSSGYFEVQAVALLPRVKNLVWALKAIANVEEVKVGNIINNSGKPFEMSGGALRFFHPQLVEVEERGMIGQIILGLYSLDGKQVQNIRVLFSQNSVRDKEDLLQAARVLEASCRRNETFEFKSWSSLADVELAERKRLRLARPSGSIEVVCSLVSEPSSNGNGQKLESTPKADVSASEPVAVSPKEKILPPITLKDGVDGAAKDAADSVSLTPAQYRLYQKLLVSVPPDKDGRRLTMLLRDLAGKDGGYLSALRAAGLISVPIPGDVVTREIHERSVKIRDFHHRAAQSLVEEITSRLEIPSTPAPEALVIPEELFQDPLALKTYLAKLLLCKNGELRPESELEKVHQVCQELALAIELLRMGSDLPDKLRDVYLVGLHPIQPQNIREEKGPMPEGDHQAGRASNGSLAQPKSVSLYPYVCPECGRGHFGAHGVDSQPCDNCRGEFAQAVGMST